jgi:predicted RecA/RadA family phage recombinase
MADNYIQEGNVLTVTAPSGGLVSGQAVLIGSLFGVACTDIAEAADGELSVRGVYAITKATVAWSQGDKVYWDNSAKKVTNVSTSNTLIGIGTEDVVSGDATGNVRINPTAADPVIADVGGVVDELEALTGGDRLSADALKDGSTNKAYTGTEQTKLAGIETAATADMTASEIRTALETLTTTNRLNSDAVKTGSTNAIPTLAQVAKIDNSNAAKTYCGIHTVTAGEASATAADIDTGFAVAPTACSVMILRANNVVTADADITFLGAGDAGKIHVANGSTYTVTENDVIHVIAMKA